jgi:hypothetical protein
MDPNQTLADFLVACETGDANAAREALANLTDWLARDGCLPEVKRDNPRNFWIGVPITQVVKISDPRRYH